MNQDSTREDHPPAGNSDVALILAVVVGVVLMIPAYAAGYYLWVDGLWNHTPVGYVQLPGWSAVFGGGAPTASVLVLAFVAPRLPWPAWVSVGLCALGMVVPGGMLAINAAGQPSVEVSRRGTVVGVRHISGVKSSDVWFLQIDDDTGAHWLVTASKAWTELCSPGCTGTVIQSRGMLGIAWTEFREVHPVEDREI